MANAHDKEWIAWAAGVVDGEGCIQLVRYTSRSRNTRWNIRLSVGNSDPRMLTKLCELFGGKVFANRHLNVPATRLPMWAWVISCAKAETALRLLLPWLIVKRDQAVIALEARTLMRNGRGRKYSDGHTTSFQHLEAQIKALKRRPFLELVA